MTEQQINQAISFSKKFKKVWRVIFNLAYVIINIAYASLLFIYRAPTVKWLPYLLLAVAALYLAAFVTIMCLKNKNIKRLAVKNYRLAVKILKNLLLLSSVVLSVVMITNTVVYDPNSFSFAIAIISIVLSSTKIIVAIFSIVRVNSGLKYKEQNRVLKKALFNDLLEIIQTVEQEEQIEEQQIAEQYYAESIHNSKSTIQNKGFIEQIKTIIASGIESIFDNAGRIMYRISEYSKEKKLIKHKKQP